MAQLAKRHDGRTITRLDELAQREAVSANFLVQILNDLRRAGLVESRRGKSGGYLLARKPDTIQLRARRIVGNLAVALQASQLLRHGHPAVAEAFVASRLAGDHGDVFGTLPAGLDLAPIIERATLKGTDEAEEFIA